ncbi:MAG: hypothetical protein WCF67_01040, partial [Chitinophagaceae bacterium]
MRNLILYTSVMLFLLACQKDTFNGGTTDYLKTLQLDLKNRLSGEDFKALDLGNLRQTTVDSIGLYVVRIPFQDKH